MNQPKKLGQLALAACLSLTLNACSKADDNGKMDPDPELTLAAVEADTEAEILYDDAFNSAVSADESVAYGGGGGMFQYRSDGQIGPLAGCYTIDIQTTEGDFPVTVTIDFGSEPCEGADGRSRRGRFTIVYSGHLLLPGSTATTQFDNYYVNGTKVEGTHVVKNTSSGNQFSFETKITNGKLTRANGSLTNWNRTRTFTLTSGATTPLQPLDDVYTITSNGSGSLTAGSLTAEWTSTTRTPLTRAIDCNWIGSGVQDLERNGGKKLSIEFGNGTCDNRANIVVNGVSREITLK